MEEGFKNFKDIVAKKVTKKAPAYQWQDLALRIIKELNIPAFKRSSVFKACKNNSQQQILRALSDTKELCKSGEKWKYFFKVVDTKNYNNQISRYK